ncbi:MULTISPECIES: flagellar biosynthesis protein FlhB [Caproicibacterium]|uniref:Flagellar biosynthetic protein FlhB n=1 Tax=Caproicibacterium argilliputei TaxID=3030016 RepID=A0AA97D6Q3_9FIRM|nr:flagellar biosynthesis protein FlhB [Caproicibacterium argilliputei]WOC31256.1 flagellar biosynthesis protein FlhB [Caproicibacterium argilliputei]
MAQNSSGEKTEQATPKRKTDERKKGNVFLSQELVTVATMLVSFVVLRALGSTIFGQIQYSVRDFIQLTATMESVSPEDVSKLFIKGCITFAIGVLPVALGCSLAAVVLTLAQTKFLFSSKSFAFKANRMSPLNGIRNLFSMRGIMELVKSILKILLLSVVAWNVLSGWAGQLPRMIDMQVGAAFADICDTSFSMAMQISVLFVALAAFDYLFQWWDYNKKLRMTKQEVKEEYKETEGDPQVKGAIKDRQQAMSRKRMMQNVPNADVVIRNPTHVAVAIRYDPKKASAPVVVAKGLDSLALRIVKVAEENGVYITENVPLARGLYAAVDLDQEIPEKYYKTVAEVLAFVYKLKKKDLNR